MDTTGRPEHTTASGTTEMEGVEQTTPQPESSAVGNEPLAPPLPAQPTLTNTAQPAPVASTSASTTSIQPVGGASTSAEESIHVYGPATTPPARTDTGELPIARCFARRVSTAPARQAGLLSMADRRRRPRRRPPRLVLRAGPVRRAGASRLSAGPFKQAEQCAAGDGQDTRGGGGGEGEEEGRPVASCALLPGC